MQGGIYNTDFWSAFVVFVDLMFRQISEVLSPLYDGRVVILVPTAFVDFA